MRTVGIGHFRVVLSYWLWKITNLMKEVMVSRNLKIQRMVQNLWTKRTEVFMEIL